METQLLEKWVIGEASKFGPCREYLLPVPQHFVNDENWYFMVSTKTAVPQSRVFDTPQEAALAAVKLNNAMIDRLKMENARLLTWHQDLESERERKLAGSEQG